MTKVDLKSLSLAKNTKLVQSIKRRTKAQEISDSSLHRINRSLKLSTNCHLKCFKKA